MAGVPQATFLLSSSFSGSTLLSRLMAEQTSSVSMGDTYLTPVSDPNAVCTCGAPIDDCALRSDLRALFGLETSALFARGRRYPPAAVASRTAGVRLIRAYEAIDRIGLGRTLWRGFERRERKFVEAALASCGCNHYFDGSKSLVRTFVLARRWESAVVHLVRDPRDVVVSAITKHGKQTSDPMVIASHWVAYNAAVLRVFSDFPNFLPVRFQDLTEDPDKTMQRVIASSNVALARHGRGAHAIGNRSRLAAMPVSVDATRLDRGLLPPEVEEFLHEAIRDSGYAKLLLESFE